MGNNIALFIGYTTIIVVIIGILESFGLLDSIKRRMSSWKFGKCRGDG